jgi:hypothetical protein
MHLRLMLDVVCLFWKEYLKAILVLSQPKPYSLSHRTHTKKFVFQILFLESVKKMVVKWCISPYSSWAFEE